MSEFGKRQLAARRGLQDSHQINGAKKTGFTAVDARAQPESLVRAFASFNLVAADVGAFVAQVHGAVADPCGVSPSRALSHLYPFQPRTYLLYVGFA